MKHLPIEPYKLHEPDVNKRATDVFIGMLEEIPDFKTTHIADANLNDIAETLLAFTRAAVHCHNLSIAKSPTAAFERENAQMQVRKARGAVSTLTGKYGRFFPNEEIFDGALKAYCSVVEETVKEAQGTTRGNSR